MSISSFYKNKKVLITGDTGFKGSWLALWLVHMGAKVYGLSNDSGHINGVFQLCRLQDSIEHFNADITDRQTMNRIFSLVQPEIVFHLAAQPIVHKSHTEPLLTLEVNVMGTVHILECIRQSSSIKAAVLITTDKCYENTGQMWGYRESDSLGGTDPYSASKACCELITNSYAHTFLNEGRIGVATARSGNVVGGGDWGENRLIPDMIKAIETNSELWIRNSQATRPWQHVLDSLYGYLLLGSKVYHNPEEFGGAWNFGPPSMPRVTVKDMVSEIFALYGMGSSAYFELETFKEMKYLSLDSTKSNIRLNWQPRLPFKEMMSMTVDWYRQYETPYVRELCIEQIETYSAKWESGQLQLKG